MELIDDPSVNTRTGAARLTNPARIEAQLDVAERSTVRVETAVNQYETDLDQNAANYVPLTPLSFLPRSAATFPDRVAVVHGDRRYTWAEVYQRSCRLASALSHLGIRRGDTVSVMATNTPPMYEAHFGVPMSGAVLNALNYRLDSAAIAFILEHAEAKVLLTDTEFAPTIEKALATLGRRIPVIDLDRSVRTRRQAVGRHRLRGAPRRRRSGRRLDPARRRVGGDLAQLHVGHHRQSRRASSTIIAAPI